MIQSWLTLPKLCRQILGWNSIGQSWPPTAHGLDAVYPLGFSLVAVKPLILNTCTERAASAWRWVACSGMGRGDVVHLS
nr:unnamed protein product [Digitaria exilis]